MIGRAIHQILKNNISDLSSGGVFPVIIPQNSKIDVGQSYPSIVYSVLLEYVTSKQLIPNVLKSTISLTVVSNTYKEVDDISIKTRNVLDRYQDLTKDGINDVIGFVDNNSNPHNFSSNIDINNIFYIDEEDNYLDDLFLYSRTLVFDVYYYDNINIFSYNLGGSSTNDEITNPLMLSFDATMITNENKGGLMLTMTDEFPLNNEYPIKFFNKLGGYYAKETPTETQSKYDSFFTCSAGFMPQYKKDTYSYLDFTGNDYLRAYKTTFKNISLCYGALFIYVYKPTVITASNYLSGNHMDLSGGECGNMVLNHMKLGSNVIMQFNPCGSFSTFSSETETLFNETDANKYWDADIHFLALSVGGNKAQTGGDYNNKGWFEYFNSNYNPKLTTGQIKKDNSFSGNSNTYDNSLTFAGWGDGAIASGGFRIYETLVFAQPETTTRSGTLDSDSAPFQPTDLIYKKIKDYIYNKYKSLK